MSHRIALTSSKGGTGKTTTSLNLAVALAERGRRTLLVDLDPQGAVGLSLARGDTDWGGLAEVFASGARPEGVLVPTNLQGLSILPRGRLDPVDVCAYERHLLERGTVSGLLDRVDGEYEYVIVDTPSGLGAVTRVALESVGWVIIPLQAEPVALRAVGQTLRVLHHVRENENPALKLLGILPTMVQLDQESSLNVMSVLWREFAGLFDTVIPRAEAFARASELGIPVAFMAGRTPPEARRFALLADEVEGRIDEGRGGSDEREHRRLV